MFDTLPGRAIRLRHPEIVAGRYSIKLILMVLIFATIPVATHLFDNLFTPDESVLLVYPEQILSGRWPNRDFFMPYGPGQFWLLAGVYKIFGVSLVAERLVGWILHIAIALGVVRIAMRRGRFVAGTAGCASAFILAFLGLPAFAWLGALSLTIWSIAIMVGTKTRGTSVVAGLLVGLVFAVRPELGPVAILCQLPLIRRTPSKSFWILGFGLGSIPIVIHLTLAGHEFVKNILFLMREASAGVAVPPHVSPAISAAAFSLMASALALAWRAVRERDPGLLAVTLLSILILPQAFQRTDLTHIVYVGCFIWPMWFAMVFSRSAVARGVVHRYGSGWLRQCFSVAGVVLMSAILMMSAASWRTTFWLKHLDKSLPMHEATAIQDTNDIIAATNQRVRPGSRIFVGAVDMSVLNYSPVYLYFLLPEYRPAGYYLDLFGGYDAVGKKLSKDIQKADALLLSDMPMLQHSLYRNVPRQPSYANDAVARYFCAVGRYGDILLYIRCHT